MRKKVLPVLLSMFFLLSFISPTLAAPVDEVTTFGYSDLRNREGNVQGGAMGSRLFHFGGPSYSQPLILDGDRWGGELAGRQVAITVEGNEMYGYLLPDAEEALPYLEIELQPKWNVKLSGSTPTKSHPTFYEKDSKKYIVIGTYSKNVDIIDITNFNNAFLNNSIDSNHATDITSAPLIMQWNNHDIIVATSGNTGKVFIIADPFDKTKIKDLYIEAGPGRTSSSPAPLDNGRAFAVGLDQGRQSGELRIYYLDDILQESPDGKVEGTGKPARIVEKTNGGLAASFAVDGNTLYFGDTRSNIYAYNIMTKQKAVNNDNVGIFSNRSPALVDNKVIFPAVGEGSQNGKLVAVDRHTGKTLWTKEFSSRAQTAPAVLNYPGGSYIWEGTSDGWLASIDPDTGNPFDNPTQIASRFGLEQYASGVSGEISAVDRYALITTEQGVIGAFLFDDNLNLQVLPPIETGVPEGEKAMSGQTYNGQAVFKYEQGIFEQIDAPVGVFYGDQYLKLYDENGTELPKAKLLDGSTTYYLPQLNIGEERTIYFNWTAGASNTLRAVVNKNSPPVANLFDEVTLEDNEVTATIAMDLQNLIAEITSYPEEALAGDNETVTGQIINEDDTPINTTVRWSINGSTVYEGPVTVAGTRDVSLPFTMPSNDATVELEVNPDRNQPPGESSWTDNKDSATINLAVLAPPQGDGNLILTPNPAKWWEMISAKLEPPTPRPPKGTLTSWSITSAKLTYPKKHPEWTFGHPLDPVGTTTINMSTGGHTSTVEFRQDWSNYGSDVYDVIDGRRIPGPTNYNVTATYTIKYEYEYQVKHRSCHRTASGRRSCHTWYETKTGSGTTSGSATASLLVNGTSVLPRAH